MKPILLKLENNTLQNPTTLDILKSLSVSPHVNSIISSGDQYMEFNVQVDKSLCAEFICDQVKSALYQFTGNARTLNSVMNTGTKANCPETLDRYRMF